MMSMNLQGTATVFTYLPFTLEVSFELSKVYGCQTKVLLFKQAVTTLDWCCYLNHGTSHLYLPSEMYTTTLRVQIHYIPTNPWCK